MSKTTPRLRAAVVGAGAGGTLSIDALLASARYELAGVADMSPAARARLQERTGGAVRTFETAEELFAATEPEVVCISTYAPTHLPLTELALATPSLRGLLVEKPLGDRVEAGRRILEQIVARDLPVVVPHGLMTQAAALAVVQQTRGGAIGDLQLVEMECTGWDIVNAGIHWLQFFGALVSPAPVRSVLAAVDKSTRTFRDGMQVETEAITMARTDSGVRVLLNTGDAVPQPRGGTPCFMRIIGSRGLIEYGAWEDFYVMAADGDGRTRVDVEPFEVRGHQRHLEFLADQIESGSRDYVIPDSSLLALDVVEAAYASARTGRSIALPSDGAQSEVPLDWNPGEPYSGVGGGRDGRAL